jgi:NAD(P)-dependent dehydrogenase (short-subunit alcohol dehydrogenase family)
MNPLIISQLGLEANALRGETVIVTGAGGGIGYEAARSLLWLGANVVIAEINQATGKQAAENLAAEFDQSRYCPFPPMSATRPACRTCISKPCNVSAKWTW